MLPSTPSKKHKDIHSHKRYGAPLNVSIVWLSWKPGRLEPERVEIKTQITNPLKNSPKEETSSFTFEDYCLSLTGQYYPGHTLGITSRT